LPEPAAADRQRLDKWLWYARMARTRTLAARLVGEGHVRLNGRRVTEPAKSVRMGDVLTLALAHATLVVSVQGFAERRGGAPEARRLYTVLSGPDLARADDSAPDEEEEQAPMRKSEGKSDNTSLAPEDD
jgi:ribosome-associated heat shock protein Hsp15